MTAPGTDQQINSLNAIEHSVSMKTNEEIEILIEETEETLQVLMDELKKRRDKRLHKDIDNLDEHLKNADISFKSLKDFIAMALKEMRG